MFLAVVLFSLLLRGQAWIYPINLPAADPQQRAPSWRRLLTRGTALHMGGYYNEPDRVIDHSRTHMIFGVRCLETATTVPDQHQVVTSLQPVETANELDVEYGPAMVQYLVQQSQSSSLQGVRVLEIGASSTSLTAALVLGAASVVVCHPDPTRLRLLDHAHDFLNAPLREKTPSSSFHTHVIQPDMSLPDADVVVFSMNGLNRLHEAVSRGSRVLLPSSIIPAEQKQRYPHHYECNGILEISLEWSVH